MNGVGTALPDQKESVAGAGVNQLVRTIELELGSPISDLLNGREIEMLKAALIPLAVAVAGLPRMANPNDRSLPVERRKRIPSSYLAVARKFLP